MQLFLFCLFSEVYEKKKKNGQRMNERGELFASRHWRCQGIKQPFTPERGASGAGARQNQILCSHVRSSKVRLQTAGSPANVFPSLQSRCVRTKPERRSASHTEPAPSGGQREARRRVTTVTSLRKPRRENEPRTAHCLRCAVQRQCRAAAEEVNKQSPGCRFSKRCCKGSLGSLNGV